MSTLVLMTTAQIISNKEINNQMARNNYIKQMISTYGETWIVALRPEDIQRSAKRIAKELVRGEYDFQEVGNYFLDTKFIDNLAIAFKNEYDTNLLYLNALTFYRQYNPAVHNVNMAINHCDALCKIYGLLTQKMNDIKYYGNIGVLADTSALLYGLRNHMI